MIRPALANHVEFRVVREIDRRRPSGRAVLAERAKRDDRANAHVAAFLADLEGAERTDAARALLVATSASFRANAGQIAHDTLLASRLTAGLSKRVRTSKNGKAA